MKKILLIIVVILISSCNENKKINELKEQNNLLKEKVNQLEKEDSKPEFKSYSEQEAISFIKDHYNFYKSDFKYKNIKLRKRGPNLFDVSIEEAFNHDFENMDYVWNTEIYTLEINQNGEYNYSKQY